MSQVEYRFDELDNFEKQLIKMIKVKFPQEIEKQLYKLANEVLASTKMRTPVDTGRLRNSWHVGKIKKVNDEYFVEVYTNVNYALHIEYGHRTPTGGFVRGRKMLTISIKLLQQRLNTEMRVWLEKMLEELKL